MPVWLEVLAVCLPVACAIVSGGWAMTRSVSKKSEEATIARFEKSVAPLAIEVAGMRSSCDAMKAELHDIDVQVRGLNCKVHDARIRSLGARVDGIEAHNGALIQRLEDKMLDGFRSIEDRIERVREGSGLHRIGGSQG
jgi:hypothetical protein